MANKEPASQAAADDLTVSANRTKAAASAVTKGKRYRASIYPETPIPAPFAKQILELEAMLEIPIWLIVQNGARPWGEIGHELFKGFQRAHPEMADGEPAALLIESPGGDAHFAYRIARMLQNRTGDQLTVIVPQYAKSAATLLALGGASLIMGRDAELGPLDVQMFDIERETVGSALDAYQALERLNAFAMTAVDQTMFLLMQRSGKRTDVILPQVLTYVASFLRPLLEKIDTLDYTKKSRELKVAEEYAVRLMRPQYRAAEAKRVARQLVEKYPTHGFVIDSLEASSFEVEPDGETFGLGLNLCDLGDKEEEVENRLERLTPYLDELTVIGRVQERT